MSQAIPAIHTGPLGKMGEKLWAKTAQKVLKIKQIIKELTINSSPWSCIKSM
jgi:hypothetical protein